MNLWKFRYHGFESEILFEPWASGSSTLKVEWKVGLSILQVDIKKVKTENRVEDSKK